MSKIPISRTCRDCGETKESSEFIRNHVCSHGIDTLCKVCNRKRVYEWRKQGKRNTKQESKRYYDRYPWKGRARQAKRRAAKRQATPVWADHELISIIYEKCPEGYHVDHIIPLQGKTVCGLHCETNLQWLPSDLNFSKFNKFNGEPMIFQGY